MDLIERVNVDGCRPLVDTNVANYVEATYPVHLALLCIRASVQHWPSDLNRLYQISILAVNRL
jgi:hypothetical protein